jgi:serine phosphatase RsbU (regulator of sigma subunit)
MRSLLPNITAIKKIPRLTALTVVAPTFLAIILIQVTSRTVVGNYLDQKITHPALFRFKEWWQPSILDPRIKILSFDNRTAAHLKAHDLTLKDWAQTIQAIASKENVRLVIPKIFDSPYEPQDIEAANKIFASRHATSRITNLVYTSPHQIDNRSPINVEQLNNNLRQVASTHTASDILDRAKVGNIVYGAPDTLLSAFSSFGHADYTGDNRLRPLICLENGTMVPQLALAGVGGLEIGASDVKIMGQPLRISDNGSIIVNTVPDNVIRKRSLSLLAAVILARSGKDLPPIKAGDYIVVIPAMFTGATDYAETALGTMPGSFLTVSVLNSALTGAWIREIRDPGVWVLLMGLLGFCFGYFIKPSRAALSLILVSLAITTVSLVLFAKLLIVFSFLLPVAGVCVGGLSGLITQSNVIGIEDMRMQKELEIATVVQKSFFPPAVIDPNAAVQVTGRFAPASECGGDWWGQMRHGGYSYLMIGDAVGHGVPAALVTAAAFSATKLFEDRFALNPDAPIDPSLILDALNKVLCAMNSELACMTFLVMRIHDDSGQSIIANAGNPQPIIIPADPRDQRLTPGQRSKLITARGDVLGLSVESQYKTSTATLAPGDRIMFYTDGLIENSGHKTKKPLGKNWIKSVLPKSTLANDFDLGDKIWNDYKTAIGSMPPDDDTTVVMITYRC